MKINGQTLAQPKDGVVVIPRGEENIIFKVSIVTDFSEYERLCPRPSVPVATKPDGSKIEQYDDKDYIAAMDFHIGARTDFMIMSSLKEVEWEMVNKQDPKTWGNVQKELEMNKFLPIEIDLIFQEIIKVNGLSDEMYKEARESFLAGEATA